MEIKILKRVLLRPKSEPGSQTKPLAFWTFVYVEKDEEWIGRPTFYGPYGQQGSIDPEELFSFPKNAYDLEETEDAA